MNPILGALQSLGIIKKPKIISPLPASDSPGGYNDPTQQGLNAYYQREGQANSIMPKQAMKNTTYTPAPQVPGFDMSSIGQAITQLTGVKLPKAEAAGMPKDATPYETQASGIFNKYGVPPAVGLGIWAMEGRGKTINPNNPYNIGAYDSNPQNANAYQFKNPLQGTDEAAKFLAGQSSYQTPDVQKVFKQALAQYKKSGDQNAYLKTIAPTYSTNPQYASTIQQTPEYQRWSYNQ